MKSMINKTMFCRCLFLIVICDLRLSSGIVEIYRRLECLQFFQYHWVTTSPGVVEVKTSQTIGAVYCSSH